jgi:hypothetical protein
VYGIDVQALDFEKIKQLRGRRIVRSSLERVRERWQAASKTPDHGRIRNELNAEIVLHFVDLARASAKQRNTKAKVFYFAHNGHVALNSHESRSSLTGYMPDGHWIAELLSKNSSGAREGWHAKYLSVGTYAPVTNYKRGLLTFDQRSTRWREQQRRIQRLLEREPASSHGLTVMSGRVGRSRSGRTSVDGDMGMHSYRMHDFDFVVVAVQSSVS